MDLFADFQGWELVAEDRTGFVTRATHRDTFEEHGELRGLLFGRRRGGALSARIYDKTAEMAATGASWLVDQWGAAYQPGERVLEVQFEFGRTVLRELGVNRLDDLFERLGGLWAYATEDWLSLRSPPPDEMRSLGGGRRVGSGAEGDRLRGEAVGLERIARASREAALRQVRNGLRGYAISYARSQRCS